MEFSLAMFVGSMATYALPWGVVALVCAWFVRPWWAAIIAVAIAAGLDAYMSVQGHLRASEMLGLAFEPGRIMLKAVVMVVTWGAIGFAIRGGIIGAERLREARDAT